MLKKYFLGFFLLFSCLVYADEKPKNMQQSINIAEKCAYLNCVRNHIDTIDAQLVTLLGERLAYVKRAGELKGPNVPVHDQARENKILDKVSKAAETFGYSGEIARAVFVTLLKQSNSYERR